MTRPEKYRYASRSWIYSYKEGHKAGEGTAETRELAISNLAHAKMRGAYFLTLVPPGDTYDAEPGIDAEIDAWIERYKAWECPHPVRVLTDDRDATVDARVVNHSVIAGYVLCLDCRSYLGTFDHRLSFNYFAKPIPAAPKAKRTGAVDG